MRFRDYSLRLRQIMSLVVAVAFASPAAAQFREINPDQPDAINSDGDLVPTRQPFVPPSVEQPAKPEPVKPEPVKLEPAQEPPTQPKAVEAATLGQLQPVPAVEPAAVTPAQSDDPQGKVSEIPRPLEPTKSADAHEIYSAFESSQASSTAALTKQFFPLQFRQVEPGKTTVSELKTAWGEPVKTINDDFGRILIYRVDGFRQVDVHPDDAGQTVQSILVHLQDALSMVELQRHLGLEEFDPVVIPDETGTALAQGFPERGVLMTYDADSSSDVVSQVSLEVVQSELFRLRAEHDLQHQDERCLADLEQATRMNPDDAKAYWLQAELLSRAGRNQDARDSARIALRIEPQHPLYKLTVARLDSADGDLTDGLRNTRSVLDDPETQPIVRARAEYQLGNLIAMGPEPSFEQALTHHMKAIELAAKQVADERFAVRRMAKDVLVDAHLAVAQDIALGNFQRKRDVVPKWLTRATQLAEDFIDRDAGDETIRMEIYRSTLAIYSVMEGNFDASVATEEALNEGRRLIAAAADRIYQSRIERELSEALLHAAKVEHRRGRGDTAMTYANNSVALLEGQNENRQPSLVDQIMEGQLYFMLGSLYAVNRADHQEAVNWYEQAKPMFDNESLTNLVDGTSFGDLFVSMGVSYWEVGQKDKAVEMTQIGADLIQQAVQSGGMEMLALTVPYGNLAAMHKNLGNGTEAQHFAEMMARVEKESATARR